MDLLPGDPFDLPLSMSSNRLPISDSQARETVSSSIPAPDSRLTTISLAQLDAGDVIRVDPAVLDGLADY